MIVNTTQYDQQTLVLELSGKLNFPARQAYQQALTQAEVASPRHIIFDLTQVSYIDSAGLGLLALSHKKLTGAGIHLSLANTQESVRPILTLTNMDKMLGIYDSVSTASQGFKANTSILMSAHK